jgi:addiction module RelE/StbE family toxin
MPNLYRVRITPRALCDLQTIFDYIAQDSPDHAAGMIERIFGAIDGLEFMPYRFKVLEGAEKKGIRSIPVRPYLVRFRVEEEAGIVRILHVRHGARRPDT